MSSVNHLRGTGLGGDAYATPREMQAKASPAVETPSGTTGNTALDELNASWLARHPEREERIRARREADAAHIAQSRELEAMQARIEQGEEPRYFEADGSYWVAYAGEIGPANAVENAWIEAQERQGNHVLSDADEQVNRWAEERGMNDAAVPERPALSAPTSALAAHAGWSALGRPEVEWGGFDR